jgi:hypothetical protein
MTTPSVRCDLPRPQHRVALALPHADTDMMQLHLDEILRNVATGAHVVLLLDGGRMAHQEQARHARYITPIFLPSRALKLNLV